MRACVIVFPGSNCDRDIGLALSSVLGKNAVSYHWHKDLALPKVDLIVLPGGFSYGDYLRAGAIAARAPIMQEIHLHAQKGAFVLGICNGFQILTEAGFLPGALRINRDQKFICKSVDLQVENNATPFTHCYTKLQSISLPIAHGGGNYTAPPETLAELEAKNQIVLRYLPQDESQNPNGSASGIAGICDPTKRILGLMPHPERAYDPCLGQTDGQAFFNSLASFLN
jgi:phosphoribosylformylglycinamidine synthase